MTEYLIFPTKDEAVDRSRAAWAAVLGRKKNPEDVTEFLWPTLVGKDGQAALVVNEKIELLTQEESLSTVAELNTSVGGNWETGVANEVA